jgi:hypothetical protein
MSLRVQTKRNQVVCSKVIFLFCPEVERNFVIIYNNVSPPICSRQITAIILHYSIFWWMPARGCVEQLENVRGRLSCIIQRMRKAISCCCNWIRLEWGKSQSGGVGSSSQVGGCANQLMRGTKASIGTFQLHYLHGSEWKIVCYMVLCYFTAPTESVP